MKKDIPHLLLSYIFALTIGDNLRPENGKIGLGEKRNKKLTTTWPVPFYVSSVSYFFLLRKQQIYIHYSRMEEVTGLFVTDPDTCRYCGFFLYLLWVFFAPWKEVGRNDERSTVVLFRSSSYVPTYRSKFPEIFHLTETYSTPVSTVRTVAKTI